MPRTEIDGDQIQDETVTGSDILDDSIKPVDVSYPVREVIADTTILSSDYTIVVGAAAGPVVVTLPDATTLVAGRRFELVNRSPDTACLKDSTGATIFDVVSGDAGSVTLEFNPSPAGTWISTVVTGAATGITSYVITSDTTFITNSSLDSLITNFSVTPVSGRYAVFVSADVLITQNNRIAQCVVYTAGAAIDNTRREVQGVSSNYNSAFSTIGEITVDGTQAVDVRVNVNSGSLSVFSRSLVLIRLGGA